MTDPATLTRIWNGTTAAVDIATQLRLTLDQFAELRDRLGIPIRSIATWAEADNAHLIHMHKSGDTYRLIARRLGRSIESISSRLRYLRSIGGIPKAPPAEVRKKPASSYKKPMATVDNRVRAVQLWRSGSSVDAIKAAMGLAPTSPSITSGLLSAWADEYAVPHLEGLAAERALRAMGGRATMGVTTIATRLGGPWTPLMVTERLTKMGLLTAVEQRVVIDHRPYIHATAMAVADEFFATRSYAEPMTPNDAGVRRAIAARAPRDPGLPHRPDARTWAGVRGYE